MSLGRSYRWGAVLGCYLYRALSSALVALPLGLVFGGVLGEHPRGDEVLWDRGGIWLLEAARLVAPQIGAVLTTGGALLMVASFGWLLPLGALIASQAPSRPGPRACMKRAGERLGPLAAMLGGFLLVQALVLAGFGVLGRYLGRGGSHLADVLKVVVPSMALLVWWLLGVLHDALRVVYIQRDRPWWGQLNEAWELLRVRVGAALLASAWRRLLGLAVMAGAMGLSLRMSGPDGSLGLVVVVQQAAILAVVLLRASWLGWLNRALFSRPPAVEPDAADEVPVSAAA